MTKQTWKVKVSIEKHLTLNRQTTVFKYVTSSFYRYVKLWLTYLKWNGSLSISVQAMLVTYELSKLSAWTTKVAFLTLEWKSGLDWEIGMTKQKGENGRHAAGWWWGWGREQQCSMSPLYAWVSQHHEACFGITSSVLVSSLHMASHYWIFISDYLLYFNSQTSG